MNFYDKWYSELGFVLEIENTSIILSGQFTYGSVKYPLRGVGLGNSDQLEMSFIITWETNTQTSTVFTGRRLDENVLSLDWLLFMKDLASSKTNTFSGNLVLNRYTTERIFTEVRQDKLPFPKILYNDLFLIKT